jgi:glucokinase
VYYEVFIKERVTMRYTIGVDLGGTNLRAGLVDTNGTIYYDTKVDTIVAEGPQAIFGRMVSLIQTVQRQLPADGTLAGVGIGVPGPLDPVAGFVFAMPNIQGFENTPLRAMLAEATGLDIELGNDANAAAVGEWVFGAGQGLRDLVYITVSTGIGGGVIADGHLLLGHKGSAGEVGHHIIDWHTRMSWEDTAAGPGFARRAAHAMRQTSETALHQLTTPDLVQGYHIAQAAAAGDAVAQRLMDEEGEAIGAGLVNMLHLYSPAKIVLGGGVVINNPQLVERAKVVIAERAIAVYRDVPVEVTQLGDRIGLLGAAALYDHMRQRRA